MSIDPNFDLAVKYQKDYGFTDQQIEARRQNLKTRNNKGTLIPNTISAMEA